MKCIFIYIILFLFTVGTSQNLVPNSSFETFTVCPTNSCNIETYATLWTAASVVSSTDYFNICSVSCKLSTQFARTGNGHAGFIFLGASSNVPDQREYLQIQLTNPLINNKTYFVEFFVMLRDLSIEYGCNNIAANFSITRPYSTTAFSVQPLTPHIQNSGNPIINDKINWVQVSGCYTAQGGEEYLTIGNFMDDAHTQTTGTGSFVQSYYLIDDVRVEEIAGVCVTGVNELSATHHLRVYPNPALGSLKITMSNLRVKEKLSIKIVDIIGKEVMNVSYKEEIDISELEQGIYFLSIYKNDELLGTKKVIKK